MATNRISPISIENAHIIWPNFSGKEGRYNREGDRNFSVKIEDPALAQRLSDDGWNIRILRPRDEDEQPKYCLNVAVNFKFWKQPEVWLISGRTRTKLDEESIGVLDGADIVNADLVIRPRQWDDNGETRIKAYLQELWVTIEQSRFAAKYASEEYPEE